jgi:lysophospholipid acyltransferase (LPLAT)-like uncharacterized protein
MTIEEVIAKLLQRREMIIVTGNAQIQEITATLTLLGYVELTQATVPVPDKPKGE